MIQKFQHCNECSFSFLFWQFLVQNIFLNNQFSDVVQHVFVDDPDLVIVDVDFSHTHLVLILREGRKFRLCAVRLPLPVGRKV